MSYKHDRLYIKILEDIEIKIIRIDQTSFFKKTKFQLYRLQ